MVTLLAFVVAIGVLVTVHELGHYYVARWCGVKILRFSVGFGPVLFKRHDKHGTEWALSLIPLGGYVKMLDEREESVAPHLIDHAFNQKSVYQRFAIVIAGPVANLVLASVIYAGIFMYGTQQPIPTLAQPAVGTLAEKSGFRIGDRILAIGDEPVMAWADAQFMLVKELEMGRGHDRPNVPILVGRKDGSQHLLSVNFSYAAPSMTTRDNDLSELGFNLGGFINVASVESGSAAEQAGLQAGDMIVRADTLEFPRGVDLQVLIRSHPEQTFELYVVRNNEQFPLAVTPKAITQNNETFGMLGLRFSEFEWTEVRYGLFDSIWRGVHSTYDKAFFSLRMMGKMLIGEQSWSNITGPITIADYAGQTAKLGLVSYLSFLAIISVSIGVLNLLPIPMLDGGHLMYYLIEMVTGKPVSERFMMFGQRIGIALLFILMSVAIFNDFFRLFSNVT